MANMTKSERQERIRTQMKLYHGTPAEKDRAIDEIVNENISLIVDIINKHYPSYKRDYFEDLKQEGVVGLLESLEVFDPEKGALATIATFYIIHHINDYISRYIHGVRPHYNRYIKRVRSAMDELERRGITNPSLTDIAILSELSVAEVRRALDVYNKTQLQSYESEEYLDSMVTNTQMTPDEVYEDVEKHEILSSAMAELTPQEVIVVCMKYRIGDYSVLKKQPSNQEISQESGIPLHMIRQITQQALRKLRNNRDLSSLFNSQPQPDYDPPIAVAPLKSAEMEANYLLDDSDVEVHERIKESKPKDEIEDLPF